MKNLVFDIGDEFVCENRTGRVRNTDSAGNTYLAYQKDGEVFRRTLQLLGFPFRRSWETFGLRNLKIVGLSKEQLVNRITTRWRENVQEFVLTHKADPLMFRGSRLDHRTERFLKTSDLNSRIDLVLELTQIYTSVSTKTGKAETEAERRRSLLDIWRHLSYYKETNILSLAKRLYLPYRLIKHGKALLRALFYQY
jgi:hypothetical protein